MDLLQLKYFQNAANTENFSQTAANFMVPPSCISLYIKKLEAELDTKLFDRVGNRIRLNDNGRLFLSAVDNVFLELEAARPHTSSSIAFLNTWKRAFVSWNPRIVSCNVSAG